MREKATPEAKPPIPPVEPPPSGSGPSDPAPPEPIPAPTEADPPTETTPEPADAKPTQPKRSSPPKTSKPKPKSDKDVAKALEAKILAKCKDQGTTTVKIEGVISPTGTVASLYITPPTDLGACAKKIVSAAKFDAAGGVRPIPRFSVEL
jgi:hypothetical protein